MSDAIFQSVLDAMEQEHLPSLAQRTGVSYGTLYHWSRGLTASPRLSTLLPVAQHLGLTIEVRRRGRRGRLRPVA